MSDPCPACGALPCDQTTEPTARGDEIAAEMRAYYEANKPLRWWQRRRVWESQSADSLMLRLLNIARKSAP